MFDDYFSSSSALFYSSPLFDTTSDPGPDFNPATGLPMAGGTGSLDTVGNPWGSDIATAFGLAIGKIFEW